MWRLLDRRTLIPLVLLHACIQLNSAAQIDFPVLKVGFCSDKTGKIENCEPLYVMESKSGLKFGDLQRSTVFHDKEKDGNILTAFCSASEPLRWSLQMDRVKLGHGEQMLGGRLRAPYTTKLCLFFPEV